MKVIILTNWNRIVAENVPDDIDMYGLFDNLEKYIPLTLFGKPDIDLRNQMMELLTESLESSGRIYWFVEGAPFLVNRTRAFQRLSEDDICHIGYIRKCENL